MKCNLRPHQKSHRSKYNWYEHFKFRKVTRSSKHKKKLAVDDKKITKQAHILEHIREFYVAI